MQATALILLFSVSTVMAAQPWSLDIYSEHYPPMNYLNEQGQPAGVVYEVVVHALHQLQRPDLIEQIRFVPWARGYHETLHTPNTMLFSIIRTAQREPHFIWVGPVYKQDNYYLIGRRSLFGKLKKPIKAKDLTGFTIGVMRQDYGQQAIEQHPVLSQAKREIVNTPAQAAQMLMAERVDLMAYSNHATEHALVQAGAKLEEFSAGYRLAVDIPLYLAFNPHTDPKIIQLFEQALEQVLRVNPDTDKTLVDELDSYYRSRLHSTP